MLQHPFTRRATDVVTHPRETAALVGRTAQGLGLLGLSLTQRAAAGAVNRAAGLAGSDLRIPDPESATTQPPPPTEAAGAPETPAPMATGAGALTGSAPAPDLPGAETPPTPADLAPEAAAPDEADDPDALRTPAGIPAADPARNPATAESDLHQPDTEPLMDPSATKAARSEATTMSRAADRD